MNGKPLFVRAAEAREFVRRARYHAEKINGTAVDRICRADIYELRCYINWLAKYHRIPEFKARTKRELAEWLNRQVPTGDSDA